MAQKKNPAAIPTAERMRRYRARRADSGQVNYAAQIPGSAARALDAKAGKLGLTRAEYLVELSRGKAASAAVPPRAAHSGGGDPLRSNKRFRDAVEAIIRIRDKTIWRPGRSSDVRERGTVFRPVIDRIAADLRQALPADSRWDDIGERL